MPLRSVESDLWQGRQSSPGDYFYQSVKCLDPESELPAASLESPAWALMGYAVDEGVRRNFGRTGAAGGPALLRERLGRLPDWRRRSAALYDLGDVYASGQDLEEAQASLAALVFRCQSAGYGSLVMGGGHDMAWAHYLGLRTYLDTQPSGKTQRIGIINFDAHLDMRDPAAGPNSGTPFRQVAELCQERKMPFDYLCIGAQRMSNTPSLWKDAEHFGAQILSLDKCGHGMAQRVSAFCASVDKVYITVDLDGFAGQISPGVSAPGVRGLRVEEVLEGIGHALVSGKVIAMDIAEYNPRYDIDLRTARLGAFLMAELLYRSS